MGKLVYLIAVIKCNQQTKTAMYVISAVQLCITKISTPECRGGKTLGVPSTSKSRGDMSPCLSTHGSTPMQYGELQPTSG